MSTHKQGNVKESGLGLGAVDQGPAVSPVRPLSLSFQLNLSKLFHRAESVVSEYESTGQIIKTGRRLLGN